MSWHLCLEDSRLTYIPNFNTDPRDIYSDEQFRNNYNPIKHPCFICAYADYIKNNCPVDFSFSVLNEKKEDEIKSEGKQLLKDLLKNTYINGNKYSYQKQQPKYGLKKNIKVNPPSNIVSDLSNSSEFQDSKNHGKSEDTKNSKNSNNSVKKQNNSGNGNQGSFF